MNLNNIHPSLKATSNERLLLTFSERKLFITDLAILARL